MWTIPLTEDLKLAFSYDPLTGLFTNTKTGKIVGKINVDGYVKINIQGTMYSAHRLAYFFYHGVDPGSLIVDHINRVKDDNRISNLRLATPSENSLNHGRVRDTEHFVGSSKFVKQEPIPVTPESERKLTSEAIQYLRQFVAPKTH